MKKHVWLMTALLVGLSACTEKLSKGKSDGSDLITEKDKFSYALGQQYGRNLQSLGIEYNQKILVDSMIASAKGETSKMTDVEMSQAFSSMREQILAARKKDAENNKAKGDAFLEKNKSEQGIVETKSGLQYKIIEEGKGKSPTADDMVKVHYKGTLIDGTEFDSSYKRNQPAEFPVGGVIAGWTEALQLMKPGAKWKLFIPAALAYGESDRPSIPGNSVLIFDVELLEVLDQKK
ncbi:MAG: FKBP-type peptidyl-prolyl cis-trans isomerase [Bdellovibrionota bacterium]